MTKVLIAATARLLIGLIWLRCSLVLMEASNAVAQITRWRKHDVLRESERRTFTSYLEATMRQRREGALGRWRGRSSRTPMDVPEKSRTIRVRQEEGHESSWHRQQQRSRPHQKANGNPGQGNLGDARQQLDGRHEWQLHRKKHPTSPPPPHHEVKSSIKPSNVLDTNVTRARDHTIRSTICHDCCAYLGTCSTIDTQLYRLIKCNGLEKSAGR